MNTKGSKFLQRDAPLPMTRAEIEARGWDSLDILLITGDAYVDHPAFAVALLGRLLESQGYRVGIVAQPRWDTPEDIQRFGIPRLFVGISAGSTDSLVANHTAHRKGRRQDRCSPGGRPGLRPDRATLVYAHLTRRAFGGIPIILGGIEASCRRLSHFDFWQGRIRRPILFDAKADLSVFGMGEGAILEIARRLRKGDSDLSGISGTCRVVSEPPSDKIPIHSLPSFEAVREDPSKLHQIAHISGLVSKRVPSPRLYQTVGERGLLVEPPPPVESGRALDRFYELPYTREAHPSYGEPIPALDTVRWSLTSHRGCFGGCSFCSLALFTGHKIGSRTPSSLVREARGLTKMPGFPGTLTDVGGPTANMYKMGCRSGAKGGRCKRASCLFPTICGDLNTSHTPWLSLLEKLRNVAGIEGVRVASGIRHDLLLEAPHALGPLLEHHVGGRLRVAPEHVAGKVLRLMRKPTGATFEKFVKLFKKIRRRGSSPVSLSAYLMTAFPGSGPWERSLLAQALQTWGIQNCEVQCFTPTPATTATALYASGRDLKGKDVPVTREDGARKASTHLEPPPPKPRGQSQSSASSRASKNTRRARGTEHRSRGSRKRTGGRGRKRGGRRKG